jgi:tRNA U55 pseudouridine synthase TruB
LGQVLGVGAYVEKLRRTKIGDLDVENALKIEEVEKLFREGKPEVFLKEVK